MATPETLKHGIKECCEFMEVHASNGVVLNGFLLWLDIQRQTTPGNLWKVQAVQRFLKEEITDAKEILWRTVGDSIIGKKILRKGPTKMVSEVNDICTAMKLLSEKVILPMFLGTSTMVSQTPLAQLVEGDNTEVNAKFKEIEESINSLVTALSTKNVSDQGVHATSKENSDDASKAVQNQIERASCVQTSTNSWADITATNINLPLDIMKLPETEPQDYNTDDDEGWTKVEKQPKRNKCIQSWRQRLGILRGTAIRENDNESLSADVHLVAYSIAKNVTGI